MRVSFLARIFWQTFCLRLARWLRPAAEENQMVQHLDKTLDLLGTLLWRAEVGLDTTKQEARLKEHLKDLPEWLERELKQRAAVVEGRLGNPNLPESGPGGRPTVH